MALSRLLLAPFRLYNDALEKHPLSTKSITSGGMYAAGDVIAQYAETYNYNRNRPPEEHRTTQWNKNRTIAFFIFGIGLGGPAFHYWFNYLNELPALLWYMKQIRHRDKILRAYAYLKAHGITVQLDKANLPKAAPLDKWKTKLAKILADQGIFAPIYNLVFFSSIGMLVGALERHDTEEENKQLLADCKQKQSGTIMVKVDKAPETAAGEENTTPPSNPKSSSVPATGKAIPAENTEELLAWLYNLKNSMAQQLNTPESTEAKTTTTTEPPLELSMVDNIIQIIAMQQKQQSTALLLQHVPSWSEVWDKTWAHTKSVFWQTYMTDCLVWPPLQLINFTFVPLKFQFLFVNMANLAWNTFLSWMANSSHGGNSDDHAGDTASKKKDTGETAVATTVPPATT
jgi:hypothetical protein